MESLSASLQLRRVPAMGELGKKEEVGVPEERFQCKDDGREWLAGKKFFRE